MGFKGRAVVTGYPFLYLGEGPAGYFEWGSVHVLFDGEVSAADRPAIADRVPAPLTDSIQWHGSLLSCSSDQFIHAHIASNYDPGDEEPELDGFLGMIATDGQCRLFERDIAEWLAAAHARHPVIVAIKPPDAEGGGTEFGDWHRHSALRVPSEVLPRFAHVVEHGHPPRATGNAGWALYNVLEMYLRDHPRSTVPPAYLRWYDAYE